MAAQFFAAVVVSGTTGRQLRLMIARTAAGGYVVAQGTGTLAWRAAGGVR